MEFDNMKLGFLEKILPPKNEVFYECFEYAAKTCDKMAVLYNEAITNGITEEMFTQAKMLKHKGVNSERKTLGLLNSTFITPIDREDIQMLAAMLNKITKKLAQAFMNINVYRLECITEEMIQQAKVMMNATTELKRSVSLLKTIHKTQEITESHDTMKEIETLGDDILYRATDKLFSGEFSAIEIIKLTDIYRGLESALDKCYSVSDEILNIALKND